MYFMLSYNHKCMYMSPMQLIHILFDAHDYKNQGGNFDLPKIINMKFISITNKKATSTFHEPVQMPAFSCLQSSQGAAMC